MDECKGEFEMADVKPIDSIESCLELDTEQSQTPAKKGYKEKTAKRRGKGASNLAKLMLGRSVPELDFSNKEKAKISADNRYKKLM